MDDGPVSRKIRFGSGRKAVHSPYIAGLLTLTLERKRGRRDIYVNEMNSNEPTLRLEGTKKLARLLEADPRTGDLRPEDVLVLIGFLKHRKNPELQFYALYALTNVDANGGKLIGSEALPSLVQLMKSKKNDIKMQVLITLSRIVYDFPEHASFICTSGALKALQSIVAKYKYDDIILLNCSNFLAILYRAVGPDGIVPMNKPPKIDQIANFLLQRGLWYETLLPDVLATFNCLPPSTFGRKACTVFLGLISHTCLAGGLNPPLLVTKRRGVAADGHCFYCFSGADDPLIVVSVLQVIMNIFTRSNLYAWRIQQILWILEGGLLQHLYSLSHCKYKIVKFQVCYILNCIVEFIMKTYLCPVKGDFEIVQSEESPACFSIIKNLVTGQQIDFSDPEFRPCRCLVCIGPFSCVYPCGFFCQIIWTRPPRLRGGFFSEKRWLAEVSTQKKFWS